MLGIFKRQSCCSQSQRSNKVLKNFWNCFFLNFRCNHGLKLGKGCKKNCMACKTFWWLKLLHFCFSPGYTWNKWAEGRFNFGLITYCMLSWIVYYPAQHAIGQFGHESFQAIRFRLIWHPYLVTKAVQFPSSENVLCAWLSSSSPTSSFVALSFPGHI